MQKEVYEFISQQTNDPIVEWRTCAVSGEKFAIFQSDVTFYEKISPTFGDETYQIPLPTLCPEERQKRRLVWRNERNFYWTTCCVTGERILSMYDPKSPYKVVSHNYRRGDARDPCDFGQDIDYSRPFFEQRNELQKSVYVPALHAVGNEDCEYVNQCGYSKHCYLSFNADYAEECYYSKNIIRSLYCVDTLNASEGSEYIYDSIDIATSTHIVGSQRIHNSQHLIFCEDCSGCHDCFACANLVNAAYCFNNEQLTKEAYEEKINSINLGTYDQYHEIKRQSKRFFQQQLKPATLQSQCEVCVGNNLVNCSSSKIAFDCFNIERVGYSQDVSNCKNTMDFDIGGYDAERCYENISSGEHYRTVCSSNIWTGCRDIWYSNTMHMSENCFGCVSMRNKQYCILNKQYSEDDYYQELKKLITHMQKTGERGEFLPIALSPFTYNDSVAQDQYPLTSEEAENIGYAWRKNHKSVDIPQGMLVIDAKDVPNDINKVEDTIVNYAIVCSSSQKPFRVTKKELQFYRKMQLPLPRKHPDIRYQERLAKRPGRELYVRKCDKTGEQILSVYPQEVPFEVYSDDAYQQAIYG